MWDAELLYRLRCDREAGVWYRGPRTSYDDHFVWLGERIVNPLVEVLVQDDPLGAIRIDSNGELAVDGGDQAMLLEAVTHADRYGGRLKACVDAADRWTWRRLLTAGFEESPDVRFLVYRQ